ncbi:Hpt domain-containing protein [Pseudomonas stutzeri]|uniref:Histidine kinase n=1 Tax=Stutzerimonas stutzeri TaxID=316 RepID=A0A2N8S774_STUST|nr:Hpt domain-containing protein [Stutzerimonas stutzeri]MCQ4294789.1 Hpt domain-containing protein [Stutzerimonas stutzeri]PNF82474.1 histidine kinase [Stutzerimonas stutzeri]
MSNTHLDSAVLATLQDVMESEYPALLDTFLADSEERVRLLRQAYQAEQTETLRRAAHSFKGSCSNMGAVLLADLCQELETAARGEQLAQAPVLIASIEREFAIVGILFRAERQRYA